MSEPEKPDSTSSGFSRSILFAIVVIGVAFLTASCFLFLAEQRQAWEAAKFAANTAIVLVIAAIIGFEIFRSFRQTATEDQTEGTESETHAEQKKDRDEWLIRLVIVTALGMCIIVLYSVEWINDRQNSVVSVALLSAGATWLIGVVVGFLFGIPHQSNNQPIQSNNQPSTSQFRPSTSLEEVADWLTKIIVGVGLADLKEIPGKLDSLATYIATGMGASPSHKVFALAICVYFASCGFLFGFLWARLYMLEAFDVAGFFQRVVNQVRALMKPSADTTA